MLWVIVDVVPLLTIATPVVFTPLLSHPVA